VKFVFWKAYHLESRSIVDEYVRLILPALSEQEVVVCESDDDAAREIADADVMIGWRITPPVFASAKRLRWVQFGSAGLNHTMFPELESSDVVLTTLSGVHTTVVAEHVIAQMLALARRLDTALYLASRHSYDRSKIASQASVLRGKTLLIVGLGKIGSSAAQLAKAFGMRVVGTKRTLPANIAGVDGVFAPDKLRDLLPDADFVALLAPLTQETNALIGRSELALMKRGANLINVARGAMIDHDALAEALRGNRLAGAALDVFPTEPLEPDSPIYDLPNTVITPHTAASFAEYAPLGAEIVRQNVAAFLSGGEMVNVYDRGRGY